MTKCSPPARVIFSILLALAVTPPCTAAEGALELAGLWQAKRNFTPEVRGDLRVFEEDGVWRAEIGGFSVVVETTGSNLRFEIPGSRGYFRGARVGKNIKGHWVQPRTQSNFAPYASPVHLISTGSGRWRGEVRPLNDTLHFYLVLEPGEDGSLKGFIRNPEANIGRFYGIEQVVRDGDSIQFIDGDGQVRLKGTYRGNRGQLSLFFPFNGGTYDFVRVEDDSFSGFYPRPRSDSPYRYRAPVAGEGWQTNSLKDVGMATGPIEEMIQMIIDTPMDSVEAPYIHAFLVARDGQLVMEEYFHGFTRDTPHGTRSASKSVTTTLAGIAINQGRLSLVLSS